jgi:hypothetical protein
MMAASIFDEDLPDGASSLGSLDGGLSSSNGADISADNCLVSIDSVGVQHTR